jgi:hypothetical protein
MRSATINLSVKVAKVGVFRTRVEITDDQTDETVRIHEKEYPKTSRLSAAKRALVDAQKFARLLGFDQVSELKTAEKELQSCDH